MAQFIFTARNGIHIIDLQKTMQRMKIAYNAMKEIAADGGKVLFVGPRSRPRPRGRYARSATCTTCRSAGWAGFSPTSTRKQSIERLKELDA
jgi:small subunit ribosomal protein S2